MFKSFDTELIAWSMVVILAVIVAAQTLRTAKDAQVEVESRDFVADGLDQSNEIHAYWADRHRTLRAEIAGLERELAIARQQIQSLEQEMKSLATHPE